MGKGQGAFRANLRRSHASSSSGVHQVTGWRCKDQKNLVSRFALNYASTPMSIV